MRRILVYVFLINLILACSSKEEKKSFEAVIGELGNKTLYLENDALKAIWSIEDKSIVLKEFLNKYDHEVVNLENVILFSLELADRSRLSNHDFKMHGTLALNDIATTDSLPTKSLRYSGKKITGNFLDKEGNISIQWSAQLREGSNYIRQNIIIKSIKEPVEIRKVTFFDGELPGATYAGSVLGSPIDYKRFFFGLEHPIAMSDALLVRDIGNITPSPIDVSAIIDRRGNYEIAVEHGGGPADFNITSIALEENGVAVSIDEHPLNGDGGSSIYRLQLADYDSNHQYRIKAGIIKNENANGRFHIYRKTDGLLNFFVKREDVLIPGKSISEWSVMGVVPENQKRRAFLKYIERERARPYKQFLHYNCWWDITGDASASFTSEQLIERMHGWNQKFIEPYNINLNSFVFDDGWDDLDSIWFFDPIKFPEGFHPQATLCREYNSGIGVWLSPYGGYGSNKKRRIESAKREGLEINDKGLSLSGPNYYERFLNRTLDMLDNYHVNYFKFDGFGGSNPQYLPDMEAGAKLIGELRKRNPDVFVNITVGSWPSPFWLKYADCTWRGSGDAHQAGQGSRTQKFITYRDGTLHNNIVRRAPYYPLNSIMVAGIAYANRGLAKRYVNDNLDDFKDMVRSFFAAGSSLQELYISHDRMKDDFWPVLAEAASWAKANEDILIDVHWIGGSPINLEVYGFASWRPGKGIIMLRNPGFEKRNYNLHLTRDLELGMANTASYQLKSPWLEDSETHPMKIKGDESVMVELEPFGLKIYEILPVEK